MSTRLVAFSCFLFVSSLHQPNLATGQTATVRFESIPVGSQFGSAFGTSPGDTILIEDNIVVRAQTNAAGDFILAVTGGFTASQFGTTPMTIGNIDLEFDLNGLPFAVSGVTFDYADFGGHEYLGVNGTTVLLDRFALAPISLGGASISVTESPFPSGVKGRVSIAGAVNSLRIGGQELGIDDVKVTGVPEPAGAFLAIAALGLLAIRRASR